ncbi:MAG: hypothetical protein IPN34_15305 [Planctomycetes bacterium]|nr:hypothetical protein [Planctomycetota bacterium]
MSELLTPLLLAVLAIVDAGFSGYRSAAGTSALLRKDAYYRRAIRHGLRCGAIACALVAGILGVLFACAATEQVWSDLLGGAGVLVWSFGVYATLVLLGLGVWFVAEADLRTLASVLVLGPFTLIRPLWIAATCAVAALGATTWLGGFAPLLAGVVQLAIEPWLRRAWAVGGARRR